MNKQFFRLLKNMLVRFREYSLRTKLPAFFMAVPPIPLGIPVFIVHRGAGNYSPRYL